MRRDVPDWSGCALLRWLESGRRRSARRAAPTRPRLVDAVKRGDRRRRASAAARSRRRQRARGRRHDRPALGRAGRRRGDWRGLLHPRRRQASHAANRYGVTPLALAATNGSDAARRPPARGRRRCRTRRPPEGETVLMTAARTGNAPAVERLLKRRRRRERRREVARRNGADVGGGRESRRGGDGARRSAAPTSIGVERLTFPNVRYNLATHGHAAAAAGRLHRADVRGAAGRHRCGARAGRCRRRPQRSGSRWHRRR